MFLWLALVFLLFGHSTSQAPPDIPDKTFQPGTILSNRKNTSANHPFQLNLNAVIDFLQRYTPSNGYATCLGYGEVPNKAFGHSGCYNMSSQQNCSACIQFVYSSIQQAVPYTVGARLWINDTVNRCYLRFEEYDFSTDLAALGVLGVLGPNASSPAPSPATAYSPRSPIISPPPVSSPAPSSSPSLSPPPSASQTPSFPPSVPPTSSPPQASVPPASSQTPPPPVNDVASVPSSGLTSRSQSGNYIAFGVCFIFMGLM